MSATLKDVGALVDELKRLSSGEVQVVISNPTNRPSGERVVISAFGQEYGLRNLAGAAALLELWKGRLNMAGFATLSKEVLPRAYRATLFRTSGGGWRIDTQAMDGAPITDSWSVPTHTSEAIVAVAAANRTATEHKFTSAFLWTPFPERENMLVTILLEP